MGMGIKKEIVYKKLNEIKPYEKNPRINDNAVEEVKVLLQLAQRLNTFLKKVHTLRLIHLLRRLKMPT